MASMTEASELTAQLLPPSATQRRLALLLHLIDDGFNLDELRILCFDLEVDFENLRGESKTAKVCDLILYMRRRNLLDRLETAVRGERPTGPHQGGLHPLCQQLNEWEQVRSTLQHLRNYFAPCRGLIYGLRGLEDAAHSAQSQRERLLSDIDIEWQTCKGALCALRLLAVNACAIAAPYDPESGSGPHWYVEISKLAEGIDRAMYEQDVAVLQDNLPAFGHRVDELLHEADRVLRKIVDRINQLRSTQTYEQRDHDA